MASIVESKTKKRRVDMAAMEDHEDRLSNLPDTIIGEILSLLPFETVIAASTLSHDWRRRLSPHLISSLTFSPSSAPVSLETASLFWASLNNTFNNLVVSPLSRSLILNLPPIFYQKSDNLPTFSDSWLNQICGTSIQKIQLTSSKFNGICGAYYFVAPSIRIFQMISLKVLLLGGCFSWNLPSDPKTIRLPNLKKLNIHVVSYQVDRLGNLITSIPSLEDLSYSVNGNSNTQNNNEPVQFSSPNLNRLSATIRLMNTVMVVDAPLLEHLKIVCYSKSRLYFVQKLSHILEASLNVLNWGRVRCHGTWLDVTKAVSNVRRLEIGYTVNKPYTTRDRLSYTNLTTLVCKLSYWTDINLLNDLLYNCPVLEVLKLVVKNERCEGGNFDFVLNNVKLIELELWPTYFNPPMELLKHLVSKACVLEKLKINAMGCPRYSWKRWKPLLLKSFEELFEYQEKLLGCHIEFSGFGAKVSCNGSKFVQQLSGISELNNNHLIL